MRRRLNLPLFLIALTVAIAIKVAVHDTDQLSEKTVDAKVSYNLPEGVVLAERVKEVEVRVRGRRNDIAVLNPIFIEVFAAIDPSRMGRVEVFLDPSNVRVPSGIEVESIEPNPISVRLEPVESAVLPIRITTIGEPAAGARVAGWNVTPDWVNVTGPQSMVRLLEFIEAEPVSVDRKAITFRTSAAVISPDPLIKVQPLKVRVQVNMNEPELSSPIGELESSAGTR